MIVAEVIARGLRAPDDTPLDLQLDDADWPSVAKFIRFVRTLPCYELCDATSKPGLPPLRAAWEWLRGRDPKGHPSAVALRKAAEDDRPHRFFRPF